MLKPIVSTNIVTYHFLHHFITLSLIYCSTVLLLWTAGIHHTAYWGPHSTGKYKTHQFILKALFHRCVFSSINTRVTHTHTPFYSPFSGTTRVSRYQKGKTNLDILLKQETVSGSGVSWAICKSAPSSRQITMPAPRHSVFYRPDALPATQPTASEHWRHIHWTFIGCITALARCGLLI